jgi:hypothetical protein
MVPLSGFSPESIASDDFAEEEEDTTFVLGSPEVERGRSRMRLGRFSSVIDGKVWVAI